MNNIKIYLTSEKNMPHNFIVNNIHVVGYSIHLNESHYFEFALGVGYGSNTKAELLGMWALLLSSQMMGIPLSHIFGDSQVIINWAKGSTVLSPPELLH